MSVLNGASFIICIFFVAFSVTGWISGAFSSSRDKMGDKGVELPFKVFLALYAKAPEKWICLKGSARYGDQQVFFPSACEWRKYNRWRNRRKKLQKKEAEEKRKAEFLDGILREYEPKQETKPHPEFTTPPTVKPKTDKYSVELYRTLDGNSYIGKVLDAVQERERPNDGKCQNCKYLRFEHQLYRDTERVAARCEKTKAMDKTDPEKLRKAIEKFVNAQSEMLFYQTVTTHEIPTTEHYE